MYHVNGPFSCSCPSRELHPGPPFVQKIKSSNEPSGPGGKNQKKSCSEEAEEEEEECGRAKRALSRVEGGGGRGREENTYQPNRGRLYKAAP